MRRKEPSEASPLHVSAGNSVLSSHSGNSENYCPGCARFPVPEPEPLERGDTYPLRRPSARAKAFGSQPLGTV